MKILMRWLLATGAFFILHACDLNSPSNENCSRIAYTFYSNIEGNNGDIYSVCADGSDVTRLTVDPAYDGMPAWSPDGTEIAFVSDRSDAVQVYRMGADGGNVSQVTTDLQNDDPVWLPGGEQIAVRTTDGQGLWWWRVIDLNTNQIVDLTEASYDFFYQKQAWSPISQEIAYMSMTEQLERNDGSSQIHVKAMDGNYERALTDNIWANVNPVWSPDGRQLAFLSEMHGEYNIFALYVIDVEGGNLHQISEPIYTESAVFSWSPDGKQIAIGDVYLGRILLIEVSSGKSSELLPAEKGVSMMDPAWQP